MSSIKESLKHRDISILRNILNDIYAEINLLVL